MEPMHAEGLGHIIGNAFAGGIFLGMLFAVVVSGVDCLGWSFSDRLKGIPVLGRVLAAIEFITDSDNNIIVIVSTFFIVLVLSTCTLTALNPSF